MKHAQRIAHDGERLLDVARGATAHGLSFDGGELGPEIHPVSLAIVE